MNIESKDRPAQPTDNQKVKKSLSASNVDKKQLHGEVVPPDEHSRRIIAYIVVVAYVVLLLINIGLPILLYYSKPSSQPVTTNDIKDLMLTISSSLSGLVGVLGFIMGYYFKSVEQEKKKEK